MIYKNRKDKDFYKNLNTIKTKSIELPQNQMQTCNTFMHKNDKT